MTGFALRGNRNVFVAECMNADFSSMSRDRIRVFVVSAIILQNVISNEHLTFIFIHSSICCSKLCQNQKEFYWIHM